MVDQDNWEEIAQKALDRMKRASDRGTGCHLDRDMILALSVTSLGDYWSDQSHLDAAAVIADMKSDREVT